MQANGPVPGHFTLSKDLALKDEAILIHAKRVTFIAPKMHDAETHEGDHAQRLGVVKEIPHPLADFEMGSHAQQKQQAHDQQCPVVEVSKQSHVDARGGPPFAVAVRGHQPNGRQNDGQLNKSLSRGSLGGQWFAFTWECHPSALTDHPWPWLAKKGTAT